MAGKIRGIMPFNGVCMCVCINGYIGVSKCANKIAIASNLFTEIHIQRVCKRTHRFPMDSRDNNNIFNNTSRSSISTL